ncbi:MAG TPA: hypothetical protein VLM85_25525 [Polyangiaceae bacterium]|nr:hypothetical protein [Polyangiaceae bacterium]
MRFQAALLVALSACGGQVTGGDGGAGDAATASDAAVPSDGSSSSAGLDGNWVGTIDNVTFPSGSNAVAFTLTHSGGVVTGTVVYGNAPPPPAPSDPNAAYPPGFVVTSPQQPIPENTFVEGSVLTILGGTFDGSHVTLGNESYEVFKAWCAIQAPTWGWGTNGGAPYHCLPNWGWTSTGATCTSPNPQDSSQVLTYACEKGYLCFPIGSQSLCQCDAGSCSLWEPGPDVTLDMAFVPTTLDGTITGIDGTSNAHHVHLKKQ